MHRLRYGEGRGERGGKADLGRWRVLDHEAKREEVGLSMLDASLVALLRSN